jgi:hypothetical protein
MLQRDESATGPASAGDGDILADARVPGAAYCTGETTR